jgi:hypothetical protein
MTGADKCWWASENTASAPPTSSERAHEELLKEWAATLPENQRRIVKELPKLYDPHETGRDADAATWDELSETPDIAGTVDAEHEVLMERFGLGEAQAIAVLQWSREREHNATRVMQARVLGVILGKFLGNATNDAKVLFWALAFQSGLAKHLTRHNPHSKAKELGVTRALMSFWQKECQDDLDLNDLTFSKSPEAREKYRNARIAYCASKKGAA